MNASRLLAARAKSVFLGLTADFMATILAELKHLRGEQHTTNCPKTQHVSCHHAHTHSSSKHNVDQGEQGGHNNLF